jgi:hypothetical protein
MKITAWNRGAAIEFHLIPQLVLRNAWTWGRIAKPLRSAPCPTALIGIEPAEMGIGRLYIDGNAGCCSRKAETNAPQLWVGAGLPVPWGSRRQVLQDGFHDRIVGGRGSCESHQARHQGRRVVPRSTIDAAARVFACAQ